MKQVIKGLYSKRMCELVSNMDKYVMKSMQKSLVEFMIRYKASCGR